MKIRLLELCAGYGIVVDVLEAIFKNLLMPETTDTKGQLTLF